jgi:hypothetical protein
MNHQDLSPFEQRNHIHDKLLSLINQPMPRGPDSYVGGDHEDEEIEHSELSEEEGSEEEDVWTRCKVREYFRIKNQSHEDNMLQMASIINLLAAHAESRRARV